MRFDLSDVAVSQMQSAKLRLSVQELTDMAGVPLSVAGTSDGWDESTLIWNNQPAAGAPVATVNVTAPGWVEWDVTALVNAELTGDKRVSLRLSENTGLKEAAGIELAASSAGLL